MGGADRIHGRRMNCTARAQSGKIAVLNARFFPLSTRSMLQATDLSCRRGDRELFAGLAFSLAAGSWLQVTGNNGAGKTSLLRMLCGLAPAETGQIQWNGSAISELGDAYRAELLYLGHQAPVKEELSLRENLLLSAAVKGWEPSLQEMESALKNMGLAGREDAPARFLSQGQKRRVALAQLCYAREPLWILDEPLAALDGEASAVVSELAGKHLSAGGTLVFTSHQRMPLPQSGQSLQVGA
jgi:heme exporter protein A